jgi:predicted PurR-regulated permease PerM
MYSEKQIRKFRTILVITFSFCVIVYLSYLFADILAMLAISVLISMIFNPIVDFLERKGFSRGLSVLIVFVTIGSLIFSGFSFLLPKIVVQFNNLTGKLTQENLQLLIHKIDESVKVVFPFLNNVNIVEKLSGAVQNIMLGLLNNFTDIAYSIASIIAVLIIVPFITYFLLKDNKRIISGIINVMPNKYFEVSYSVIRKISIQLGRFVRGWIFDAFMVGLLSGIGLAILGIDNAASIGLIAGIGHLIPYFGPILGGIPAIIISVIQFGNFSMLPKILLMFCCIYLLDNGFIQPNVFSKSTDIHPLMIIFLIIIGSQTMGILGMLLAVPAATVIKTAAREIYLGYKNYKIIRV